MLAAAIAVAWASAVQTSVGGLPGQVCCWHRRLESLGYRGPQPSTSGRLDIRTSGLLVAGSGRNMKECAMTSRGQKQTLIKQLPATFNHYSE